MNARELIGRALLDFAFMKRQEIPASVIDRYVAVLQCFSLERLQYAFDLVFEECAFLPMPIEIRDMAARMPLSAEMIDRGRQRLLAKIDFDAKALPSYRDSPEEMLKLAAPDALEAARLADEALREKRPIRQLSDKESADRMAELQRQKDFLFSQAESKKKSQADFLINQDNDGTVM